jgi:hypothetical protein
MAKGKKTITGAEIGDILIAKKTVSAYSIANDYGSTALHFSQGQNLGTIEDFTLIDKYYISAEKYIQISVETDDGFGGMEKTNFYLPENADSLEYRVNPDFEYPDIYVDKYPNANKPIKGIDESDGFLNDIPSNTTLPKKKATPQTEPEEKSDLILGLSKTAFFSILGGIFLVILVIVFVSKSDEPKVVYQQTPPPTQPQPLSGVGVKKDINKIPKMEFLKV